MRWALRVVPLLCLACGEPAEVASAPDTHPACRDLGLTDRGDVRVFVVGHKQLIEDAVSYESYEASFARHADALAPCFSQQRPNLIVFPENAALGAFLIGSRGEEARGATDSTTAFGSMLFSYDGALTHYTTTYPDEPLARRLLLALTDVTWRAFTQTFSGIARDHGVWVMASADVAPAERSTDPQLIEVLGDPDLPGQDSVFVAAGPEAYNSAYLFDPEGEQVGRVDKVFLTDPEEQTLNLENGDFAKVDVLSTPFGRLGVATSRDAFYAPFMQRLDDLHADIVIQPEAFSGWTIEQLPGDWLPDVFLSSAWLHQQKYRSFTHNLTPQYTGNFFDLVFDGQVHVTERARGSGQPKAYVGQEPLPGFLRVGPWVEPDPKLADAGLTLPERRALLREVGQALLPGSGSPRENGYIDSLVAADLELQPGPERALTRDSTKPESRAVSANAVAAERNPALVRSGPDTLVVWEAGDELHYAVGATSFEDAGAVAASTDAQRRPAACVAADGRVAVAWQEGRPDQLRVALAPALGASFGAPLEVPGSGVAWGADCAFRASGELVVVFSSVIAGVPRLRSAVLASGATSFSEASPVDDSSLGLPRVQGTQVQPALSSDGLHVCWLDYRDRSWDVRAARWEGAAYSASARIDGTATAEERERLHGEPRIEARDTRVVATWTDLRNRRAHPDIAYAVSTDGGLTWAARRVVPGGPEELPAVSSGGTSWPRHRPDVALDDDGGLLVFQDMTPGKSAVFMSRLDSALNSGPAERLDDTADSSVTLTRPRVVLDAGSAVVVWEDDRPGSARIFSTSLPTK